MERTCVYSCNYANQSTYWARNTDEQNLWEKAKLDLILTLAVEILQRFKIWKLKGKKQDSKGINYKKYLNVILMQEENLQIKHKIK